MKKMLAAIMFLISCSVIAMAAPQISVPETHWDFGNVPQNATLTHDYWIRNLGTDTLRIIDVRPG
jgi:hypothetical protein